GRSDLHVKAEVIKKGISILALFLIIPFGLMGAAYAGGISMLVHALVNFIFCGNLIDYPVLKQLRHISPILILSIVIYCIVYIANSYVIYLQEYSDPIFIISDFLFFFALYIGFAFLFKLNCLSELVSLIKNIYNKIRRK